MSELGERELRRRFALQDDPAFERRPAPSTPSGRRWRRRWSAILVVAALAAGLAAAVAVVVLRDPSPPAASVSTPEPGTSTATIPPDPLPAELERLIREHVVNVAVVSIGCHVASRDELELAAADFGHTSRGIYACDVVTAKGSGQAYVQTLQGCFVAHGAVLETGVIQACGLTPLPELSGMAKLGRDLAGSGPVGSTPVVRATLVVGTRTVQLATYLGVRGLTCFITLAASGGSSPDGAEEQTCPGHDDLPADLRVVRLPVKGPRVLAGTLAPGASVRIRDASGSHAAAPAPVTVPGTGRTPILADLSGATSVEVIVGSSVVLRFDPRAGTPTQHAAAPTPLGPGQYLGAILRVDGGGGARRLVLDPFERLVGDAARKACNEAGVADCAVDSFLLNTSPQEAAAPLPDTADIEVLDPQRIGQDVAVRASVADFIEALDASPASPIRRRLGLTETYRVTVGPDGTITRIEAQYQP